MKTENKIQKIVRETIENKLTARQVVALCKSYCLTTAEKENVRDLLIKNNYILK